MFAPAKADLPLRILWRLFNHRIRADHDVQLVVACNSSLEHQGVEIGTNCPLLSTNNHLLQILSTAILLPQISALDPSRTLDILQLEEEMIHVDAFESRPL